MPKYLIEREVPGVEKLSPAELRGISAKSNGVIADLTHQGHDIQWVHSFVSENKITCVYIAPDEKTLREHGIRGGFPVNHIIQVAAMIDPMSGEEKA